MSNKQTLSGDEAFAEAWSTFVALNRDLDPIDGDPKGLRLSKTAWEDASLQMLSALRKLQRHRERYNP